MQISNIINSIIAFIARKNIAQNYINNLNGNENISLLCSPFICI